MEASKYRGLRINSSDKRAWYKINSKEAFDSIKSLKDIEAAILS